MSTLRDPKRADFGSQDTEVYDRYCPLFDVAAKALFDRLVSVIASVGDRHLVRAHVAEFRVKDQKSLRRKAKAKGWSFEEALVQATDLVGCRVICNNLQDVARTADLLTNTLRTGGFTVSRQDYVTNPKRNGYRAVHLDLRFRVQLGQNAIDVGCEVQVRTLLQDSWAKLTHADLYKTAQRQGLRRLGIRLSELLDVADRLAEDIRHEVARPRKGRKPSGARLNRSSIAFLYERAFGEPAPDYVVEQVVREFNEITVRSDGIDARLADNTLKSRLVSAYRQYARWDPSNGDLFRWTIQRAVAGIDAAMKDARDEGQAAWDEVDAIGRSELLGSLPEQWKEFADAEPAKDEDPLADVFSAAEAFGATTTCTCGTEIILADRLAQELVDHYKLTGQEAEEAYAKFEERIWNSGVETGGLYGSSTCSSCRAAISKDD